MLKFLVLLQLVYFTAGVKLDIRFFWRQLVIDGDTNPENSIPNALEVYKDMVFVTILRSEPFQISLASFNRTDINQSPNLAAYPSIAAQQEASDPKDPKIVSALRVLADRCDRLWVLDNGGIKKSSDPSKNDRVYLPALVVIDLKSNKITKRYEFNNDKVKFDKNSKFAVEASDCSNTYVYVDDAATSDVLVYSLKESEFWPITQKDVSVSGTAPVEGSKFSILYLKSSSGISYISTEKLQNKSSTDRIFAEAKSSNGKFSASFIDPVTNVLYYSTNPNINKEHCWTKKNSNIETITIDNKFDVTDIKVVSVDSTSDLYVLAINNEMTSTGAKYQVLSGKDTVNSVACDVSNQSTTATTTEPSPPEADIINTTTKDKLSTEVNTRTSDKTSKTEPAESTTNDNNPVLVEVSTNTKTINSTESAKGSAMSTFHFYSLLNFVLAILLSL